MVMRKEISEKELFETIPVPRAVATLAVPTIISQVVTMIYNLADTFFVGQIGNPYMVAAVSLVSPWFNLLTALGNLFGLGGGSLISRMLGRQNHRDIRHVSAFSVWGGAAATLVFSLLTFLFRRPLLNFLGASPDTYGYAGSYLIWVVVLGGVPTMLSLSLGHLLRSEGHARQASSGMMFGGILNVILDPVLIFGFDLDVAGAAIATAFSNLASVVFFCGGLYKTGRTDQRFPSSEVLYVPFYPSDIFRRSCVRPGYSAWQCVQYGYRETFFRIRRYSGGCLRDCKADRPVSAECFYGTVSGIYAAGRI